VIFALVEDGRRVERIEFAIDTDADIAVLREFFQFFAIGAFAAAHDGARIMMRSSGLQRSPLRMAWTICSLD